MAVTVAAADPSAANAVETGFHDNSFFALQQRKGGHRAGLDAILLAATVDPKSSGLAADFGAGNGVAGMAVLQRCAGCTMDFFEVDDSAAGLIDAACQLPSNDHLAGRMSPFREDVGDAKAMLSASGRAREDYSCVIANPPYNGTAHRISPDNRRAAAHVMVPGMFAAWAHSANILLKAGGNYHMIFRPADLDEMLDALKGRFGNIRLKPVHAREGEPAKRLLLAAQKASAAPLQILPALVLHQADGAFCHEVEEILRGRTGLAM